MTSYKTYYSRVSVSLLAFVTLAFALPMVFAILCDGLLPFLICLASLLIIYGLLFSIRYKIKDEKLQIYTLFWHQDIRISKINRMKRATACSVRLQHRSTALPFTGATRTRWCTSLRAIRKNSSAKSTLSLILTKNKVITINHIKWNRISAVPLFVLFAG